MSWRVWVVSAVVLGLQVAWLPALRPLGVVPNVALVLVVLVGLNGTASRALGVALVGGLLLDLTSGTDFGLRIAFLTLVALVTGLVHRAGFDAAGVLVLLALVVLGTIVSTLTILLSVVTFASHWPVGWIALHLAIELALNIAAMFLLRPIIKWASPGEPHFKMGV